MKHLNISAILSTVLMWFVMTAASAQTPDTFSLSEEALSDEAFDDTPAFTFDSLRSLYSGRPIAAAFAALPDSVIPLLPQSSRLDMLDYAIAGTRKPIVNALRGTSLLDTLGIDVLKVCLTGVSNVQLGIYTAGKGIVVLDYTITPMDAATDSQLLFYTPDMEPVPIEKVLRVPEAEEFLSVPKGSKVKIRELAATIPFFTVHYLLDPQKGTLTAIPTVQAAMTIENFNIIKPYLRTAIVYRWNGKRFEKIKESN